MKCRFDPSTDIDIALGQFHCPHCGEMILAGFPHPPSINDLIFNDEALSLAELSSWAMMGKREEKLKRV
jgi:hypothetical protein